jgi:hypothetical protein
MKLRIILLCLMVLPLAVNAEIYKWKDKDGKVRYSDVPPPSNMQTESLYGKKIPRPTGQPPLAPVEGDATVAVNKQKEMDQAGGKEKPLTKEEAAAKRSKVAEEEKRAEESKAADLQAKQANCKAAQSNLKTYNEGGRIMRRNEKGEREYLKDEDLAKGKEAAQADVEKYCDN